MPRAIAAVMIIALVYNAILAFASARQLPVSAFHVIAVEGTLFAVIALLLAVSARRDGDPQASIFLAFFTAGALLISLQANGLFLPLARSAAIISLFIMAGSRIGVRHIRVGTALSAVVVFAGLALEIAYPAMYVRLFEPGIYYELTRGIEPLESVDGLFRNASGFEGRFTIATLLGHRAGSIFLEQVSLGNFGVVLIGFLLSLWKSLGRGERGAYIALILLILVSTNSRILLGFILLAPVIYLVGGHVTRPVRLLLMPAILAASALIYTFGSDAEGDNLFGRIGLALRSLAELDLAALAGMHSELAAGATDSGYAYIIYAGSVLALLVLWLFVSLIVPDTTAQHRRLGLFLALYVFLTLLISGNSVFSIKVAALLWLLVGSVSASKELSGTTPKMIYSSRHKTGWRRGARAEEVAA